jgi:hypothetical protein
MTKDKTWEAWAEKMGSVVLEIAAERRKQVLVKGFTPEHDDQHRNYELSEAAACYAAIEELTIWPEGWGSISDAFTGKTIRETLIIAAALLVAEIERLDRAEKRHKERGINPYLEANEQSADDGKDLGDGN